MTYTIRVTYRQKRILDLILKEGRTQHETAKVLGCTDGNVNNMLRRLMKKYPQLRLGVYSKWRTNYDVPDKFVRKD